MEWKHVRLHLCVHRVSNLPTRTDSESFSFKRVHWRILRAASINRVTQNSVCWRWDVAEWDLNLCGLGALIRPLSWGGRISPFASTVASPDSPAHLLSPPTALLLHLLFVLFCVTLYFSPQRSVFFFIPRKRLWNWAVLYLYSSSSSSLFSEHTIYIHTDMYSLREPILYSPVSARLYLRLRQIIVPAQQRLFVLSILKLNMEFSAVTIRAFSLPLPQIKYEDYWRFSFSSSTRRNKKKNAPSL